MIATEKMKTKKWVYLPSIANSKKRETEVRANKVNLSKRRKKKRDGRRYNRRDFRQIISKNQSKENDLMKTVLFS